MSGAALVLDAPARRWVPLLSGVGGLLIFVPVFVFALLGGESPWPMIPAFLLLPCLSAYMAWRGLRAAYALRIDGDAVTVKRTLGRRAFALSDVHSLRFVTNDTAPSPTPPATNALARVRFADGTLFVGEVTADEARELANRLT